MEELKKYVNLRLDEVKLKSAKGLSLALSRLLALLLIFAVLAIVLGLLALALLQFLNGLVGAPWGTLIVCGIFLILLIILLANHKTMFNKLFIKLFLDVFYGDENDG